MGKSIEGKPGEKCFFFNVCIMCFFWIFPSGNYLNVNCFYGKSKGEKKRKKILILYNWCKIDIPKVAFVTNYNFFFFIITWIIYIS